MMNWITVIWSANAGVCAAIGFLHLLAWVRSRDLWAYLLFGTAALAGTCIALIELAMMQAQSPAQFGELLRWLHVPLGVLVVSLVWFVRIYLQAGRRWLAWLVCGLRVVVLVLSFSLEPNLNFREITGLHSISALGETIVVPLGEKNPWTNITHASGILFLVFVLDAVLSAWRRGERRRAGVIGITFGGAIIIAMVLSEMLNTGTLPVPFTLSLLFLIIILGIAHELSLELLRANRLDRDLRETRERMALATTAANLGVWECDITHDEFWVTDNIRERLGANRTERIDFNRFIRAVSPDDREATRQKVHDALTNWENFEVEYRMTDAHNVTRWIDARGRVERDVSGEPIRVRGVSIDVTERKRAEMLVRETAEFNDKVLASMPGHIAVLNGSGTIVAVNDAWKAFAFAKGGAAGGVGASYLDVCRRAAAAGDETAARALDGVSSVLEGLSEAFDMEYACNSPGESKWFLMRVVPIFDGGAVVAHTDITKLREAEHNIKELRRDLEHVQRVTAVGQLASMLAHDLSQPLGAILRNAEAGELFLQQDPPDYEETRAILEDIKRDDHRAASIIERVRSLLRRREPEYERLSIGELVDQVIALIRAERQAHRVNHRVEIPGDLPRVRADRVQLQQVMLNLLLNALDAMDGNSIERRKLVVSACRADEQTVQVAVRDTGRGIPDGRRGRLFEPFQTTKHAGLGMGLAISRTIIESHGGRIWGEDNPDGGATFRFTLKVSESDINA